MATYDFSSFPTKKLTPRQAHRKEIRKYRHAKAFAKWCESEPPYWRIFAYFRWLKEGKNLSSYLKGE